MANANAKAPETPVVESPKDADPVAVTPADTTVPGGRYEVNGKLVDANGKPLKGEAEDGE